jgi:hypothetical protein
MTMFFLFFLRGVCCLAQDKSEKDLARVSPADFAVPASPIIDSNSDAVVLARLGNISFVGNEQGWFSYVYHLHERIKILNKKAFENLATVRIQLYRNLSDAEKLDKLNASTYNLENGQVVEVKLEKKDIFQNRLSKEYVESKFTMPAIREGSIIDYSYTITSTFYWSLPSWRFQSEQYPCLLSDLQVTIPQALFYVVLKQGVHPYAVDKGSEGQQIYRVRQKDGPDLSVSATTVKHDWAMKDIPAFREESYLSCPENYIDKIEFQLARTYNGEEFTDYNNSWKLATEQLLKRDDFGQPLEGDNSLVTGCVKEAVAGGGSSTAHARAIYYYLSNHFTCTDYDDKYVQTSLDDVIKKRSGTVGDINLLLVAMLRKDGFEADPVVLCTRDHGFSLSTYPMLNRLNYVIARVWVDGKVVYLDAARAKLGFGQLDGECYNGPARIISLVDSGSVYFEADSLKEKKATIVFVNATEKGLEGTWESTLGPQESYELREKVSKKGEKAFFKDIQTRYGEDVSISEEGIDSLEKPEAPVKVHYSFQFHQEGGEAKLYISPFIGEGLHENPFKALDRKYPVEMPYARDEMYVFTMQVPEGYSVEELPKSAKAVLNGQDGSFEYLIDTQEGLIQLRCHLKLNKANFGPDDYSGLRNFFALAVKKEGETIVLKKKQ